MVDWTVADEDDGATAVSVLKVDCSILDDVQIVEIDRTEDDRTDVGRTDVDRTEVEISEGVPEQGTTVVIVVIRTVVNVLFWVSGQLVTVSGHLVIVSTSVETMVEVVDSAEVVRAPTRVLLLLYVPSVTKP